MYECWLCFTLAMFLLLVLYICTCICICTYVRVQMYICVCHYILQISSFFFSAVMKRQFVHAKLCAGNFMMQHNAHTHTWKAWERNRDRDIRDNK